MVGVQLQDLSTMLQSWSVNASAFSIEETNPDTGVPYTFTEVFDQELPRGYIPDIAGCLTGFGFDLTCQFPEYPDLWLGCGYRF